MFWRLQENVISEADLVGLVDFIQHTKRFTQFNKVKEFEAAFSRWQGCRYSVFVNSGSSANLLLVNALKELKGWREGDEILVPAVTWPTTVTPVMQCGLKPVFVDASLTDLGLDVDQVARKISPRTRGIFVAHLLGFPADIKRLEAEYNMFFAGRLPRPPWETRNRVGAMIKRYDGGGQFTSTANTSRRNSPADKLRVRAPH